MDEHYVAMLSYAAGVTSPLRVRTRGDDGSVHEKEIASSFAVIGRGDGCDIQLSDTRISKRHVYLQAIGQNLACIDLLSTTGLHWSGAPFTGWLTPEHQLRIGSVNLEVVDPHWSHDPTLKSPLDFRPRDEQRVEYGTLPIVDLELLNTAHKGTRWPINRVITLVGSDDRCRITIADERLSRVQCSLLLLPSGLWVIDLLGTGGVQINGVSCRCGVLAAGVEFSIGPYKLAAHYPQITAGIEATNGAQQQGSGIDFLTRLNRIFQAEFYHDTLIVVPLGDSRTFFYQDIHIEASRILELIAQKTFNNLVIDFSRVEHVGQLILETLVSICRSMPGRTVMCGANESMGSAFQTSPLAKLYPHYASRTDALQAVYLPA